MLGRSTHLLFACHGAYWYWNQLESGFGDNAGVVLSLEDLLRKELLPEARLVIATACESAYEDTTQAYDEAIGLPLALLHSGASGVIGAYWSVFSDTCAVILTKLLEGGVTGDTPHVALRDAQLWLRDAPARAVAAILKERGVAGVTEREIERCRAGWSAFAYVGW